MKRFQALLVCAFVVMLATLTTLYVRSHTIAIMDPAGPIAAAEKNIIIVTVFLCSLVVIPVYGMLFIFAWRYRADSPTAHIEHHPTWDHYNWIAELIWWAIPSIIIVILGVIAVQSSSALDPYKPLQSNVPAITVDVVALDWKWLFIYPEQGIASVNLVEFPENTPIHFYLTADAPMNSFWVPQLAGQIMVMPGMTTQLNLAATQLGDFSGFSGNISGEGFAGMAFTARAVSLEDFDQWVASVQASSTPLSQGMYSSLVQPSEYDPVAYYAPVDPDLFNAIVAKYMTPGNAMNMAGSASTADEPDGSMQMTP